jgi:hypothetical protein
MTTVHRKLIHLLSTYQSVLIAIRLVAAIIRLTFVLSTVQGSRVARNKIHGSKPPTLPYVVPMLGHLPEFLSDTKSFFARVS